MTDVDLGALDLFQHGFQHAAFDTRDNRLFGLRSLPIRFERC
jgi:hypothetical protein